MISTGTLKQRTMLWLRRHPSLKRLAQTAYLRADAVRHKTGIHVPRVITPVARDIFISVTANCNLRCLGCRYGRDFMPGQQLPLQTVRDLLDDAAPLGYSRVRLYGGEPLVHRDLPEMVRHCVRRGLRPWVTTNAILLKERVRELFDAGLREITVGYYGEGEQYNAYVQRPASFARMKAGVETARDLFGDQLEMRLEWLLMRPSCSVDSFGRAWEFARANGMPITVNLVHYSLPYFTEGPDGMLQFRREDRGIIEELVAELIHLKRRWPSMLTASEAALRSIPDWLVEGPAMRVPCDRYNMVWVGPDGTVQLCYVTFKLGNLHEQRFSEIVFGETHRQAARDCIQLKCPNCHCGYPSRIEKHPASYQRYVQAPPN